MEHILCAAIHYQDGKMYVHQPKNISTGIVVCGRRHHNCFATLKVAFSDGEKTLMVQGFLTSKDRFVDRAEAAKIAIQANQVSTEITELYSEDLY